MPVMGLPSMLLEPCLGSHYLSGCLSKSGMCFGTKHLTFGQYTYRYGTRCDIKQGKVLPGQKKMMQEMFPLL